LSTLPNVVSGSPVGRPCRGERLERQLLDLGDDETDLCRERERGTHLAEEARDRVLEELVRDAAVVDVAALDDLEGDVDDGPDPDCRVLTLKLDVEERLGPDRLPLELGRVEPFAVAAADLAEDAHRRVGVLVVERQRP